MRWHSHVLSLSGSSNHGGKYQGYEYSFNHVGLVIIETIFWEKAIQEMTCLACNRNVGLFLLFTKLCKNDIYSKPHYHIEYYLLLKYLNVVAGMT